MRCHVSSKDVRFGGYVREQLKVCACRDDSGGGGRPWIDPTRARYGSDPFRIKLGTTRRAPTAVTASVDLGKIGWRTDEAVFALCESHSSVYPDRINNRAPPFAGAVPDGEVGQRPKVRVQKFVSLRFQ